MNVFITKIKRNVSRKRDPNVLHSHAQIDKNFVTSYKLKLKQILKCPLSRAAKKYKCVREVKPEAKATFLSLEKWCNFY